MSPVTNLQLLGAGEEAEVDAEAEQSTMANQHRRREATEPPPPSRINVPAPVEKKRRVETSVTTVPEAQTLSNGVDVRIQQARNAAVAQAQKDGATGNFKIFDSPFGNFLVPVIPTAKELAD